MNDKALKEYLQNRNSEVNAKLAAYDHLIEVFKAIGAQEELNRLDNALESEEAAKAASKQGDYRDANPPQITITKPGEQGNAG